MGFLVPDCSCLPPRSYFHRVVPKDLSLSVSAPFPLATVGKKCTLFLHPWHCCCFRDRFWFFFFIFFFFILLNVRCLAANSVCCLSDATKAQLGCEKENCLQTLPHVLWGQIASSWNYCNVSRPCLKHD